MKVHSLSGKNYKKSIEKANQALKDLKQEINALKSKNDNLS